MIYQSKAWSGEAALREAARGTAIQGFNLDFLSAGQCAAKYGKTQQGEAWQGL